jgi:hypothetical protein
MRLRMKIDHLDTKSILKLILSQNIIMFSGRKSKPIQVKWTRLEKDLVHRSSWRNLYQFKTGKVKLFGLSRQNNLSQEHSVVGNAAIRCHISTRAAVGGDPLPIVNAPDRLPLNYYWLCASYSPITVMRKTPIWLCCTNKTSIIVS